MNYNASSKVEFHRNCRSSRDEYNDGEDFSGFRKLAAETREKTVKQKVTKGSILCRTKVKSITKDDN